MKNTYRVVGVMSGTSMDGVDLAYCEINGTEKDYSAQIIEGKTIAYDEKWRVRLSQLYRQPIEIFPKTDMFYGRFLGQLINSFIKEKNLQVDFIASHGHTIFHQPMAGFTAQIGDGAAIAAETGLPVVSSFRNMDVALGGEGAPLVPVGDHILFSEFDACLNLGGIANISFIHNGKSLAFDISPCNIVMNRIARWLNMKFDDQGAVARSAEVDPELLEELNALPYYDQKGAKSLGREWINSAFWPVIKNYPDTSEDEKMATLSEHIAQQIALAIENSGSKKILVTGGGAYNTYLLEKLRSKTGIEITVPEEKVINYKEALIFALLGVMRVQNNPNVYASVTGARTNSIAGAMHGDFSKLI